MFNIQQSKIVKTFTLYWSCGRKELVKGSSICEALQNAGIKNTEAKEIEIQAQGQCREYQWDSSQGKWIRAFPERLSRGWADKAMSLYNNRTLCAN